MLMSSLKVVFYTKKPFLVSSCLIRYKLHKVSRGKLNSCNLKIVFISPIKFKQIFSLKNLYKAVCSGVQHKYKRFLSAAKNSR